MKQKIKKYVLQAVWFLEVFVACAMIFIDVSELLSLNSFEYYGFNQWPWFYFNKVVFFRFLFSLIVINLLSIGYSYRYLKQDKLKSLIIGAIPLIIFIVFITIKNL